MNSVKHDLSLEEVILNESDSIVYVADAETYELQYLNKRGKNQLGLAFSDESYKGKKCYQALQGNDSPCAFCTNSVLNEQQFYNWEFFNPLVKEYFYIKDKLIFYKGKKCRLEIADLATKRVKSRQELEMNLQVEQVLVKCIQTLSENVDYQRTIEHMLNMIAGFYEGDRAYLFEIDYDKNVCSNTYEWCRESVREEIQNLQNLPVNIIEGWMYQFKTKGEFYIDRLEENVREDSEEYRILRSQGIQSLIAAPLVKNGIINGFIGVDNPKKNYKNLMLLTSVSFFIIDDLEKRKAKEVLERLSYYDMLTGLYNRNKYKEALQQMEKGSLSSLGIVYMDLNGFKSINECYGHTFGDSILIKAAEILKLIFEKDIYRIGGDEFVVFCCDVSKEEFGKKVRRLRRTMRNRGNISASIGSEWKVNEIDANAQMAYVDRLMNVEKQGFYDKAETVNRTHHNSISSELKDAIAKGEFVIYLQPLVDLKTEQTIGAEALVRRLDADGSLIPPDKFIPFYENANAIRHLDFYVLDSVCQMQKRWKQEGVGLIPISVNFSKATLLERNIERKVQLVCNRHEVNPKYIDIEVTESIEYMSAADLADIVQLLRKCGFSVSLDDFGSKYANLSLLAQATFDKVKFDKSLVDSINEENNSKIIKHSVSLCGDMNNTATLAEGIEDREQKDILYNLGCRFGQGYLFSRPLPITEFEKKYIYTNG